MARSTDSYRFCRWTPTRRVLYKLNGVPHGQESWPWLARKRAVFGCGTLKTRTANWTPRVKTAWLSLPFQRHWQSLHEVRQWLVFSARVTNPRVSRLWHEWCRRVRWLVSVLRLQTRCFDERRCCRDCSASRPSRPIIRCTPVTGCGRRANRLGRGCDA